MNERTNEIRLLECALRVHTSEYVQRCRGLARHETSYLLVQVQVQLYSEKNLAEATHADRFIRTSFFRKIRESVGREPTIAFSWDRSAQQSTPPATRAQGLSWLLAVTSHRELCQPWDLRTETYCEDPVGSSPSSHDPFSKESL